MNINLESLKKKYGGKAKDYANDKEKTKKLLEDAVEKSNTIGKSGPFEQLQEKLKLLFEVVKYWVNGSYKEIPTGSIILIIIGLLYFVSPVDLIPDFLPGGFVDDAFVLGLIIKQVSSDLDKFKMWKSNQSLA